MAMDQLDPKNERVILLNAAIAILSSASQRLLHLIDPITPLEANNITESATVMMAIAQMIVALVRSETPREMLYLNVANFLARQRMTIQNDRIAFAGGHVSADTYPNLEAQENGIRSVALILHRQPDMAPAAKLLFAPFIGNVTQD